MRKLILLVLLASLVNATSQTVDLESLQRKVLELQQQFQQSEKQHRQEIEALKSQLESVSKSQQNIPARVAEPSSTKEKSPLEKQLEAELAGNSPPPANAARSLPEAPGPAMPGVRAGSAYMNIGFDALVDAGWSTASHPSELLQLGDHDPLRRGFSLRNAEISLDGAVDPYFKAFANIVLKLDKNNETQIELEEVYAQSSSLPYNLQLKAGTFFTAFGRQNSQHPHAWAFVDSPIILTRAFGPEGLRNIGTQLSWLAPTPFYTELFLGVFDGTGSTAYNFRNRGEDPGTGIPTFRGRPTLDRSIRGFGDLLFTPRIASSFELSDSQTVVAGVSGAFGANDTGPHSRTEIYGADLYWKWKAPDAMEGFPFVSWQTELLYTRYGLEAVQAQTVTLYATDSPLLISPGYASENIHDWGGYSQLLWGFKPHWVAGLRGEYANGNTGQADALDPFRGRRVRVSPVLTWYPSEFSKIRLQYNFDHGQTFSDEHSIWLQFEFQLGAHAAHKF